MQCINKLYLCGIGQGEVTAVMYMMTSSNGNGFRVTGHLCGEFTGPQWIPHTKASDAGLRCFLWSGPDKRLSINNGEAGDLSRHTTHCDVIVMNCLVTGTSRMRKCEDRKISSLPIAQSNMPAEIVWVPEVGNNVNHWKLISWLTMKCHYVNQCWDTSCQLDP